MDHKKWMKIAIEEAKKSKYIPTAFCVGAAIVNNGELISTGYSRELPGNTHAEECALKKIYDQNSTVPNGSVIYTTMEPCSERLSGNKPCTDRILEDGNFAAVYVGVMEPDTFIKKNIGKERLEKAGIIYALIPGFEEDALKIAQGKFRP
ncbi:hypothetical protein CANCADRAFT_82621 [Tortispora caseinolytica NRRL Y-17796]|uniref:CMP/dCMP-type deaminase domain-containing protein n=1 Tax=Tortispora caseinolytica NRRL Y-17796 TaxID=767744 RepID=A0A1E4TKG7_9ASCO|nr:hypothetical protein CANCADRAFT_82621 [Tortispora caseinolytica NRRL Y-17796]